MTLRELRKQKHLTQVECAEYLGIPSRTYQNYETDLKKQDTIKYQFMMEKLAEYGYVDEEKGILKIQTIRGICGEIFKSRNVEYCYLFGSYAKGNATEHSDVDLLVATPASGLEFYDLVEELREKLRKQVDVLNLEQLNNNLTLTNEILKDGIKIYG